MTSAENPVDQPLLPTHDLTVVVPRQWVTRRAPERGIAVTARARTVPASGFPPGLVLQTAPRADDPVETLRSQLTDLEVEDSDAFDLEGRPVTYLRFSHRVGVSDVMCEQWRWVVDGAAVTLTASMARDDYADYCDVFEEVAASVEFRPVRRAA
ncbi:hypothetical protein [Nocardioides sp. Root190]|uniref:hypothetical protein n=1 Tax=Nocardioides sp. Root190 TaxID=1736488 RepID=UPI0012FA226D|nr:hypothetical protein [Nocardioides sp. Root190]